MAEEAGAEVNIIDLSETIVDDKKQIGACKGCFSTSAALCHVGCSCYVKDPIVPNDWMHDEIYELMLRCHGLMIITPVYWWSVPAPLKALLDRIVCFDGANPDIRSTMTDGSPKDVQKAKALERGPKEGGASRWDYNATKLLAGKIFSVYAHGDLDGADHAMTAVRDQLEWMGMVPAPYGSMGDYIGLNKPYADSHLHLDQDEGAWDLVEHMTSNLVAEADAARESGMPPPEMLPNDMQK